MDVIFLQYNGVGDKPSTDVEKMKKLAGVKVVNSALPKILVVQVRGDLEKQKLRRFSNWSIGSSKISKFDIDGINTSASGGLSVNKHLRSVK